MNRDVKRFSSFLLTMSLLLTGRTAYAGQWVLDRYIFDKESHPEWHTWDQNQRERITAYDPYDLLIEVPRTHWKGVLSAEGKENPKVQGGGSLLMYFNAHSTTLKGGAASAKMTVTPVFKWVGNDEPSDKFYVLEEATLFLRRERDRTADGRGFTEENPYNGEGFEIEDQSNGFGNPLADWNHTDPYAGPSRSVGMASHGATGRHVRVIPSGGAREVSGPSRTFRVKLSSPGITLPGTSYQHWPAAESRCYFEYGAKVVSGVFITSNAEPSFYRSDNGSLPVDRYRQGIPHPVEVGPPPPPPYGVSHLRDKDGKLSVDTRVNTYIFGIGTYAEIECRADQSTYSNPEYSWKITPEMSSTIPEEDGGKRIQIHQYLSESDLGDATGALGKSVQVKVTVTDKDNPSSTPLINTYNVTWHNQFENMKKDTPGPQDTWWGYDWSASSWGELGAPRMVNYKKPSIAWSVEGETGRGWLDDATDIVPAALSIALVKSEKPGLAVTLALKAAKYSWEAVEAEPEPTTQPVATDGGIGRAGAISAFTAAVEMQKRINAGEDVPHKEVARVAPAWRADIMSTDSAIVGENYDNGRLFTKFVVARRQNRQPWSGDKYDTGGYAGKAQWSITTQGGPDLIPQVYYELSPGDEPPAN